MHIGIFDSGVGGLSILRAMQKRLPDATFSYCCDQVNFPYGTKDEQDVVVFATSACVRFVAAARVDILVIACGTASTVTLPSVRARLDCPVIGVVPAVKPAAILSKTKHIGILSTMATSGSPYLKSLVAEFAADCTVEIVGSSRLVELAEMKIRGIEINLAEVLSEIKPLFVDSRSKLDTIVLGCTHFPLLLEELNAVMPWAVTWIDSSEAIGRRAEGLYAEMAKQPKKTVQVEGSGYTTGDPSTLWGGVTPEYVGNLGLTKWLMV